MNECEMAKAVIVNKNNSFAKLCEASGTSIPRLKQYRSEPDKLETARWVTVHQLAKLYNKK